METVNHEELLIRIAEALELINDNLYEINASIKRIDEGMSSCIAKNGNNKFLCITGNVTSY